MGLIEKWNDPFYAELVFLHLADGVGNFPIC